MNKWDELNLSGSQFLKRMGSSNSNNKIIVELINTIKSKPYSVIDFGCGPGAMAGYIDYITCDYLGIDSCEKYINFCKKEYPQIQDHFLYMDVGDYSSHKHWDFVVFNSILQYIPDYLTLLKKTSHFCDNIITLTHGIDLINVNDSEDFESVNNISVHRIRYSISKMREDLKVIGKVFEHNCNGVPLFHIKVKK